ncbi:MULTISPECIES: hypothetical protein [Ectopseudomonas]|jgi:hypothetical protein|uniref:Uncharacterized protein n=2 Tax=Ectopseudomonas TaxID=3236654 RepID=A0A1G6PQK2_9GAMM|nr:MULTISPECIES: hypothetical protein [Pseudomonas]ALN21967.1 hypothetical protein DW68_025140 [Pseudomonas mendocina S5.2]KER97982.1 hypothetical protein HN51_24545 [Pseudomonas mendocina]MBP3061878.1 hypothetical protein [Pseudomonas chengduensis]NNB75170.1 hypothetical protein [Pseudomonas chengduensis]OEO24592.1 hypothetical protein AX279_18170 [Pseudomonas sp. J237]
MPDANAQPSSPDEAAPQEKTRLLHKTRKTVRFIAAVDTWKRRADDVKYRASFPLLRAAFRKQKRDATLRLSYDDYSDEQLSYAASLHARTILLLSPLLLWVLITLSKGLGALFRFGEVTTWLLYSVPLVIFIACKLFVSVQSRRNINNELLQRNNGAAKP